MNSYVCLIRAPLYLMLETEERESGLEKVMAGEICGKEGRQGMKYVTRFGTVKSSSLHLISVVPRYAMTLKLPKFHGRSIVPPTSYTARVHPRNQPAV
jgi:hypothetical protein